MQVTFRSNPKTTGWARRIAIALLIGAGAMLVTLPLSFFLLLMHYQSTYPGDTQNMLSALTLGVAIGLAAAVLSAAASLIVSSFFGLHKTADTPA